MGGPRGDRLQGAAEIHASTRELVSYLCGLPDTISQQAADRCSDNIDRLVIAQDRVLSFDWSVLPRVYDPHVTFPFWNLQCCTRLGINIHSVEQLIRSLTAKILLLGDEASSILEACADLRFQSNATVVAGGNRLRSTTDLIPACLWPSRLLHKLVVLLVFLTRSMPATWLATHFGPSLQVDSDAVGILPPTPTDRPGCEGRLGYMQHFDPLTDECTMVR